jgi:putative intracellular protease/amidase
MAKVLFLVSGATYWVLKDGTRHATGYWAEEFANPYKIVTDAGHEVVVGTPNGVIPTVDMMSLRPEMAGGVQGALELEAIIRSAEVMRRPLKLSDVRLEDYDAVYLPGGHGPMADLAFDGRGTAADRTARCGQPSIHRVPRSRRDAGHQNPRRVALQGLPGHVLHQ